MFAIIIVSLSMLAFFLHDTIVAKSTSFKIAMMAEQKAEKGNEDSDTFKDYEKLGAKYLNDKAIALHNSELSISEERNRIIVNCKGNNGLLMTRILKKNSINTSSAVGKSAPDNFIRMVNAVRNAIE